jgi:type I restriction enzyme S subunit
MNQQKPLHTPSTIEALPDDWYWSRLDDACEGVYDCPHSTPMLTESGPLVVRSQDIRSGVLRTEEAGHVSEETYRERIAKAEPRHGDLLYSREGTYFGIAAEVPHGVRVCLGQRMVLIRPKPKVVNFRFLRYWLNSPALALHVHGHRDGTVAERLNLPTIRGLPIAVPPLRHQELIAESLGSLDDKIESNRRMNETLEAMARTLFRSWFVDFDPVWARAEGRRPPGLDAATASLFPDAFADSLLGQIPKGWKIEPFGNHADAVKGLSYKGEWLADFGLPLHNLNSVYEGGGYKYEGIKFYTGEYKDRHVLRPGDVIVANTEQGHDLLLIGYPAIVPKRFGSTGLFSHHLYRVRPKPESPLTAHFIYLQLMNQRFRDVVTGHTNGTTVNMLAADGLQRPPFVLPPKPVIDAFEWLVSPLFEKQEQLHDETPQLEKLRDALLPKLLSGEIRVLDAECNGEENA